MNSRTAERLTHVYVLVLWPINRSVNNWDTMQFIIMPNIFDLLSNLATSSNALFVEAKV